MNESTYCCLAKIGLSSQNGGYTSVCNQSKVFLLDTNNNTIRFDTHSLHDAWNSPTRKEISESLSNGVRHPNCQDCWDEEDAGRTSKRQYHNKDWGEVEVLDDQPRAIILKPGNTCNLGCRHCDPSVSSGWYRDAYKLSDDNDYNIWLKQFDHIKQSYSPDNSNFWSILDEWTPNLVLYDLFGGEPLLTPRLYQNLEYSARMGYAKDQTIHINTNGTIWHDNFNNVFSKFKCVYFDISSDGIYKQFEYMRYPAKWDEFNSNLQKYINLSHDHPNIHVSLTITISLYNIFDLPKIFAYYDNLGLNIGLNILHRPEYMNVRIAPLNVKQHLSAVLKSEKFTNIKNFLNLDLDNKEILFKKFLEHTKKVDTIREQKFETVFPEIAVLLNE